MNEELQAVIINRNADYGAFSVLFGTDSSHRWETLNVLFRDAPVDRPKIGTGRFLLIMRDRQPAGFCLFFGRFFRKCEHVICVEDIRQEHNKHRKIDTMKRTAVGVTLLAHK